MTYNLKKRYTLVREIYESELKDLLELYLHLHEDSIPAMSEHLRKTREAIIKDKNHHIIENVVTHKDYRAKGYATQCLDYAKQIAVQENCYKMMLLTGSKKEATIKFYERAGYNSSDKTAFIQWLE